MRKLPRGINLTSKPTGVGCEECLATAGWWLHLRRCAECGRIGCCDISPSQHALIHAAETGHPVVASFEPLQGWFYDYEKRKVLGYQTSIAAFPSARPTSPRPNRQGAGELGVTFK